MSLSILSIVCFFNFVMLLYVIKSCRYLQKVQDKQSARQERLNEVIRTEFIAMRNELLEQECFFKKIKNNN